ncbi:cupin domain-containing protein [Nakamurella silvestris]|nr:cupin domain-containing protein [Nakamurella silvestris]
MDIERLDTMAFDGYGSHGLTMTEVEPGPGIRVHVARFLPGGVLGRHRAGLQQRFTVIAGTGWVSCDGRRVEISVGDSVVWQVGQEHESGSDLGMTVLILQRMST